MTHSPHPLHHAPPAEPSVRLRRGVQVIRRRDGGLQVGLAPGPTVRLSPPRPESTRGDAAPDTPDTPATPDTTAAALARSRLRLGAAGLLESEGPDRPEPTVSLEVEPQWRELVAGFFPDALRTPPSPAPSPNQAPDPSPAPPQEPPPGHVHLVMRAGEIAREHLDPWMRAGRPHLVVRAIDDRVVVGPFVHPGLTACLRCLDAHLTIRDPEYPLAVAGYAAAPGRGRPTARERRTVALAAAFTAREVDLWGRGETPTTWSATWTLSRSGPPRIDRWTRHPACGCAWDEPFTPW